MRAVRISYFVDNYSQHTVIPTEAVMTKRHATSHPVHRTGHFPALSSTLFLFPVVSTGFFLSFFDFIR